VKKVLEMTLGIMTALGGFVDIGELIFTVQAGAHFGYSLLWALLLATIGISLYSEMCGRIAAVKKKAVFEVVRDRLGRKLGLVTLIGSNFINIMTCAAEIGGIAVILRLLMNYSRPLMVVVAAIALIAIVMSLNFEWIERTFGIAGLLMLVFLYIAWKLHPDWNAAAHGLLVPTLPSSKEHWTLYAYFIVGIFSSVMMPYEVYFYSSGGIEDKWKPDDLPINFLTTTVGYGLGAAVVAALMAVGAEFYQPQSIRPELLGTTALSGAATLGKIGLMLTLLAMLTTIAGSAVETCFAGAYNMAQFFGWKWGRQKKKREVPKFTASWLIIFAVAMVIAVVVPDPVVMVEYAVMFAVVVLPLTYLPILLAARDKTFMGKHANPRWVDGLAWVYLVIVSITAVAAIPLLLLTHGGKG
jgi:Mn2+/Fe2+ NRAMP family transporter